MAYLRSETASYLESQSIEMAKLADEAGFETLGHLFRMAEMEAKDVQQHGKVISDTMPKGNGASQRRVGAFAT